MQFILVLSVVCFLQGTRAGSPATQCECVPYYQCSTNRTIIENGENLIDYRMIEKDCDSYLEVCCYIADTLGPGEIITPTPPTEPIVGHSCGRRNTGGVSGVRITGGDDNEAQFGEFPWVVAIIRREEVTPGVNGGMFMCGGSLIHPQVVLTAAHCVNGMTNLKVRAGEWDSQQNNELLPIQNRVVSEIVCHETFDNATAKNDIALLLLETPVDLAQNVAPVCLPQQGEIMDNHNCVANGWGQDSFDKAVEYPVILKKVELPIVPKGQCQAALRRTRLGQWYNLHSSSLCAGGQTGRDTCKGDGGGPLACPSSNNSNIYVQAGIVSWGVGCGSETPGVYTDVAFFRNWIDNKLQSFNIAGKEHIY